MGNPAVIAGEIVAIIVLVSVIASRQSTGHPSSVQSSSGGNAASQVSATASPQSTGPSYGDGTYSVGADIQPGVYHTDGGGGCYWARLNSTDTSSTSNIIVNDNASGPVTMQIKPTDAAFETTNCGVWTPVGATPRWPANNPPTSFSDGTYAVGIDIAPDLYRTTGGNGCYWQRSASLGWATSSIIANDNASGPAIVDIAKGDAGFKTHGCGAWEPAVFSASNAQRATTFGDGTWRVGVDIGRGSYHTDGADGCYYETLSGFGGGTSPIITNDNATGSVDLTLDASVAGIKSKGCGTWTRTGEVAMPTPLDTTVPTETAVAFLTAEPIPTVDPSRALLAPTFARMTGRTVSIDLTAVDWANSTYTSPCDPAQPQAVKLRHGSARVSGFLFEVYRPIYGDLTGDHYPEAAVPYSCTGADFGGENLFIFTGSAAHPRLLAMLPMGMPVGPASTYTTTIQAGTITLSGIGYSATAPHCCADLSVTATYKWGGATFSVLHSQTSPLTTPTATVPIPINSTATVTATDPAVSDNMGPSDTVASDQGGTGPTAECVDGTTSYSQHPSGTCSHHGGVAVWDDTLPHSEP